MFGAIIGGLGALAGGLLSSSSKNKATATQKDIALQELEYQKELHKNQMQWRVEDAKKAGLHPMAALGLSSYSYSPVSSGIDTSGTDYNWIGDIGQNVDRAIQQGKTKEERQKAQDLNDKLIDIQVRKGEADADLAEINAAEARFRLQQQLFPPAPTANGDKTLIGGQNDSPLQDTSILGKDVHRLFNLAMHGDSAVLVLNPDLADAVSESVVNNTIASIVREVETGNNPALIDEIISKFPKRIQRAIRNGEMRLASIPGSGAFRAVPVGPNESFNRYNVFGID